MNDGGLWGFNEPVFRPKWSAMSRLFLWKCVKAFLFDSFVFEVIDLFFECQLYLLPLTSAAPFFDRRKQNTLEKMLENLQKDEAILQEMLEMSCSLHHSHQVRAAGGREGRMDGWTDGQTEEGRDRGREGSEGGREDYVSRLSAAAWEGEGGSECVSKLSAAREGERGLPGRRREGGECVFQGGEGGSGVCFKALSCQGMLDAGC